MSGSPTPDQARSDGPASGDVKVFGRKSSGLVRSFSIFDMICFGVLASGTLFQFLYAFPGPQVALPGVSLPLGYIFAFFFYPGVFVVYAALGSAMPRSGGDYLYQSRILSPVVGFSFSFAWQVVLWVTFTTAGGVVVATFGLQPLLYTLGVRWDEAWMVNAAEWFGSAFGIFVCAMVVTFLSFLISLRGLAFYRKMQLWLIVPSVFIANLLLIILMARSHASFIEAFDAFAALDPANLQTSAQIMAEAVKGGFENPSFSLWNTILYLSISGGTCYVIFAAQGILGETKQASSFSKMLRGFMLGGLYVAIASYLIPSVLITNAVGSEFMNAYAFAASEGTLSAPGGATIATLAMMLTSNPVVLILMALGFMLIGLHFSVAVYLNMTRVLTAMGMDGSLPTWLSKVNERVHAPVNAAIFYAVLALGCNLLYRFNEDVQNAMIVGGSLSSVGIIALTGLAAAVFPWRGGAVWETAPARGRKLFGVEVTVLGGWITFLGFGGVTVANLIVPSLGFTEGWGRALILFTVIGAAVWFLAYRAYQKRVNGVDIDLAFKQVPPE